MTKTLYTLIFLLSTLWHSGIACASNEQYYPKLPAPAPISNISDQNSSLIDQIVSQNLDEPSAAFAPAFSQMLNGTNNNSSGNETYDGLRQFWYLDVFNSFTNTSAFFANFFNNLINIYLPYLVGCLCSIVKSFFLNTDLTKITDTSATNDFSYMLTQLANTIYGIALDLSLLLFILSIWNYWTQAAWHGRGSTLSAVGRLIATMGVLLAWTTIYKFEIKLSNEMLNALFPDSTGQIQFFDLIMSTLLHKTSALPNTTTLLAAIPATTEYIPAAGSAMQGIIAFAPIITSIIVCFLAIILIYELLYLIVLKAIQTALLTAQYVFAPFFLVFLANPVTDNIATSYLRTFVEVSLWNFIWIGLLKILIILLYSNFNPWGKILTAIGVLQIMMNVPQFLAHAKISDASDFVSPHFFAKALKDISSYDQKIKDGTQTLKTFFGGTAAHSHRKEESSPPLPSTDNFSFAENNNNNLEPPPLKTNSSSPNQSPGSNNTKNTDPSLSLGNTFTTGSASTSNAVTSHGTGIASAISTASAISMAIATINNPPTNNGGSNPNSPASGPKPDPSGVSPPPPPKPNMGVSANSTSNPSQSSSFNRQPNSDTKFNQQQPISEQSNNLFQAESNPARSEKDKTSQSSAQTKNNLTNLPLQDSFIAPINAAATKGILPELTINTDRLESPPASVNQQIPPIAKIVTSNQPIAPNQTLAFHSGAFNYYKKKERPVLPFYQSNKAYGTPGAGLEQYAYNLIFNHGNSPPLMGIPPIYPDPNRN